MGGYPKSFKIRAVLDVLKPMVTWESWAIGDPPKNPENMIFIDFQL